MKKLSFLICVVLLLTLTSCWKKGVDEDVVVSPESSGSTVDEIVAPTEYTGTVAEIAAVTGTGDTDSALSAEAKAALLKSLKSPAKQNNNPIINPVTTEPPTATGSQPIKATTTNSIAAPLPGSEAPTPAENPPPPNGGMAAPPAPGAN